MKKRISFLLVMLLVVSLLASCGSKDAPSTSAASTPSAANDSTAPASTPPKPVEITTVYAIGDQLVADLMHARVEAYMKENPHVKIVEKLSNEGAYLDAIKTLDAVGELPDLIDMRNTPLYVRAGKLGELPADITGLFNTTIEFEGKTYTAPMTESYPAGIIYNKKLFNSLGINVADIKVYDDFLAVCEKIKASGVAPIVVGGSDIWHIGFWWNYFWHNNVAVQEPDWMAKRYADQVKFTDANVKAALDGLNELFQKGYIEAGWASTAESQCPSILVSGRAAMYFIGPFVFKQIEEADPSFEYGFFAIPSKDGKINVSGGPTSDGWAINAETQKNDPDKTQEVYNFIRYFFSKDVYTDFCKQTRMVPTLKEEITYEAGEQLNEVLRIAATADDKQLMWNQKIGQNEMPPNFRNFCYKLSNEWFLNVSSVDEGLKTMEAEWANVTKDFNPVKNPQ